eukprot:2425009-Pyramimonas_sp.AAC.1
MGESARCEVGAAVGDERASAVIPAIEQRWAPRAASPATTRSNQSGARASRTSAIGARASAPTCRACPGARPELGILERRH